MDVNHYVARSKKGGAWALKALRMKKNYKKFKKNIKNVQVRAGHPMPHRTTDVHDGNFQSKLAK